MCSLLYIIIIQSKNGGREVHRIKFTLEEVGGYMQNENRARSEGTIQSILDIEITLLKEFTSYFFALKICIPLLYRVHV